MTDDVKVEVEVLIFSVIDLQLRGYNGRNSGQCTSEHLGAAAADDDDDDDDDNDDDDA